MKKYRPTHTLNYYYARSMIFGAEITCYPQSVWTLIDDRIYSVKLKSENSDNGSMSDEAFDAWVHSFKPKGGK